MSDFHVFVGTFVFSTHIDNLQIHYGFLTVEKGLITLMGSMDAFAKMQNTGYFKKHNIILLGEHEFLMPGLVDCHTHAPQFPNIGLGLDKPLLEWLDEYTFPLEKKYSDINFAAIIYDVVVKRLINNGTTTACYFGSLHLGGTLELVKAVVKYHQRALVGKVSMNIENEAHYYNETEKELMEVDLYVEHVFKYANGLVDPVITPRFAVSCDRRLMLGLAAIANKYDLRIQSHISENNKEIDHVLSMNPGCRSYSEVYDICNILNNKCIMAHAVHLDDEEIKLLASKGVSIAHCPASNTRLRSGLCPVRKLLESHITVGLGTDVSGGDNSNILDAMRRTMDVSTHLELMEGKYKALNWKEVFYLATLGGAKALHLDDKIGTFEIGKEFDALRIQVYGPDSPIDHYKYTADASREDRVLRLLQRFIYLGDDRNIKEVYVKGKRIKNAF